MKRDFGLSTDQLTLIRERIASCRLQNQLLRVFIFGSRARGNYRPYSDVDLLIEGVPPVSELQFRIIQEKLEESRIPFKIDLVRFEQIFEPYRDQSEAEKVVLVDWF